MVGEKSPRFTVLLALMLMTVALAGCAAPQDVETTSACLGEAGNEGGAAEGVVPTDGPAEALVPETEPVPSVQDLLQPVNATDPIRIGTILPITGGLATFGPDMERAVQMAVDDINAAGGLMGRQVELVTADSATDPSQAPQAFNQLVQAGVVGVVGAASSGVTGSIFNQAVQNEIVLVSPASTAPGLIDREDNGFFFRVVPNDKLQGKVMAQLLNEDGMETVSTLFVDNDYGQGFSDVLVDEFESVYGGTIENTVAFEDSATTFDSEVSEAADGSPDAIVYIGYPGTGVPVMREAFQAGVLEDVPFYFSEGVFSQSFVDDVGDTDAGDPILAGCKGTTPEILLDTGSETFQDRFEEAFGHAPGLFAAQSYDAAAAIALGMAYGQSADPATFKDAMHTPWNAPGQNVTDLQQALQLSSAQQDINYAGVSGNFDWSDAGEPVRGTYGIWEVAENGTIEIAEKGITKGLES